MCSSSSPTCVLQQQKPEIATISSEIPTPSPFYIEGGGPTPEVRAATPLPAITRSHDIAEDAVPAAPCSTAASNKRSSSGWKTSKFFSRTMSSGELLRSLKKLSLNSSSEPPDDPPKPRKSKSGQQLKKRSSAGNDDEEPKARSPRSPGSFRPLSKAMSVSEPGSNSRSASSLGIVCRKEDLKAILCTAGKKFPLASPSSMRRRGHNAASPLRHTKSASFDTQEGRRNQQSKEPVRRSGSEEATRSSSTRRTNTPLLRPTPQPSCDEEEGPNTKPKDIIVTKKEDEAPPPLKKDTTKKEDEVVVQTKEEDEGTTVKWDECEVVDAVVLGDAIESFLKGSMGGDRRRAASFRRTTHKDRRAKSDG